MAAGERATLPKDNNDFLGPGMTAKTAKVNDDLIAALGAIVGGRRSVAAAVGAQHRPHEN